MPGAVRLASLMVPHWQYVRLIRRQAPSPRPSPGGRRGSRFSLSLRERAGVRVLGRPKDRPPIDTHPDPSDTPAKA